MKTYTLEKDGTLVIVEEHAAKGADGKPQTTVTRVQPGNIEHHLRDKALADELPADVLSKIKGGG